MEKIRRYKREKPAPKLDTGPAQPDAGQPQPLAPANVRVIWGLLDERMDVQGMTVAEAFQLLQRHLNIAPGVAANVNGIEADSAQRLDVGDVLEFVREAGEKGAS